MVDFPMANYPYVLGRGKILIRKETDVVWYDLFHVSEFKLNLETEEKEHENFRRSLKVVDKNVVLKAKANFSYTVDVPLTENVKKFLLADDVAATAVTQTQAAPADTELTIAVKGAWQHIKAGSAQLTNRYEWIAFTSVTTGSGGTLATLVENTDYIIDRNRGLIVVSPDADLVDSKVVVKGFAYGTIAATHGISQIKAGSSADMRRHLWFQGDPAEGIVQDVKGYVMMRPTGDMDFIGDEWQGMGFEGSFMAHSFYGDLGLLYEQRGNYGVTWPVYSA